MFALVKKCPTRSKLDISFLNFGEATPRRATRSRRPETTGVVERSTEMETSRITSQPAISSPEFPLSLDTPPMEARTADALPEGPWQY
ncbi:MAG: hypothetical protein E5X12_00435, partial [Mesorhizobium sp.]